MPSNCKICNTAIVLYDFFETRIILPSQPHISKKDGGHLIVVPKKHVRSRLEISCQEAMEMNLLSIISANILTELFGVKWFNYQENGNWSLDTPELQHLHLHIYGRHENAINQKYGEALKFPLKENLDELQFNQFTEKEIEKAKLYIKYQLQTPLAKEYLNALDKMVVNSQK